MLNKANLIPNIYSLFLFDTSQNEAEMKSSRSDQDENEIRI